MKPWSHLGVNARIWSPESTCLASASVDCTVQFGK